MFVQDSETYNQKILILRLLFRISSNDLISSGSSFNFIIWQNIILNKSYLTIVVETWLEFNSQWIELQIWFNHNADAYTVIFYTYTLYIKVRLGYCLGTKKRYHIAYFEMKKCVTVSYLKYFIWTKPSTGNNIL